MELGLDDRAEKNIVQTNVPPTLGRPATNTSHTLILFFELLHLLDPIEIDKKKTYISCTKTKSAVGSNSFVNQPDKR